jgi:hypothetical protein
VSGKSSAFGDVKWTVCRTLQCDLMHSELTGQ